MVAAFIGNRKHLGVWEAGEPAKPLPILDRIIHISGCFVSDARGEKPLYRVDDIRDHIGQAGQEIAWFGAYVQGDHVLDKMGRPPVTQPFPVLSNLPGFSQDIIIDIGHILDVADGIAPVGQITDQDICTGIGKGMSQVSGVVRGDPAHIDCDDFTLAFKFLNLSGEAVEDLQRCSRILHCMVFPGQAPASLP